MYILLVEKKLIFFFIDKSIIFYTIDNKMEKPTRTYVSVTLLDSTSFAIPVQNGKFLETAQEFQIVNSMIKPPRQFSLVGTPDRRIMLTEADTTGGSCPYGIKCYNKYCGMEHPEGRNLAQNQEVRQARLDKTTIDCKYSKCTNSKCPYRHSTVPGGAASGGAASGGAASGGAASGGAASGGRGRGCE